jgi:hypothetical protein
MITSDCLIKCVVMISLKNMKMDNEIKGMGRVRSAECGVRTTAWLVMGWRRKGAPAGAPYQF